ncbi:hypothetical protein [Lysobacter sp. CA196]|uniref:hypothetical protein n=1 Tax=Lysobacter sp. CA196 TaxID=3455606 RepID=UPI003F8D1505
MTAPVNIGFVFETSRALSRRGPNNVGALIKIKTDNAHTKPETAMQCLGMPRNESARREQIYIDRSAVGYVLSTVKPPFSI